MTALSLSLYVSPHPPPAPHFTSACSSEPAATLGRPSERGDGPRVNPGRHAPPGTFVQLRRPPTAASRGPTPGGRSAGEAAGCVKPVNAGHIIYYTGTGDRG